MRSANKAHQLSLFDRVDRVDAADHFDLRVETAVGSADGEVVKGSDTVFEPLPEQPEFVRHARARRYLIRVRSDGSVRVTIPRRGSKREAIAFYERQQAWVRAQRQRVAELRRSMPPELPPEEQRDRRERARTELPARLLELASILGLTVRKVSVRDQRQRWGSCSPSGLICLNWRLILMPDWVRDYVLYHELTHLKRMDHSPAFWALVAAVCPRYKEARRWLRRNGHAPHAAAE
jgi:predicted metal-dependent hydrolase